MRQHLGKVILIGIAIAGGYSFFSKENSSAYTMPYITVTKKDVVDMSGAAAEKAGNFVKNVLVAKVSDVFESASGQADDFIGDAIVSAKTQALNFLKGTIDKKVESLAVDLGVGLNVGTLSQAGAVINPISFAIKSETPAYFTIKNKEAGTVVYEINWKDGKIDKGQISKGESKVVSHSWVAPGEYSIKFRITSEKAVREYDVSISII